jgi:hypothetical protein
MKVPALRFRVSLRMFLLLCTGTGLILAWFGLTLQRRGLESHSGGKLYTYKRIDNSALLLGNSVRGVMEGAEVTGATGMMALAAQQEVCSQLEFVRMHTAEVLDAFQPRMFPNVKSVALYTFDVQSGAIRKLRELPALQSVWISDVDHDPAAALNELLEVPRLRHLTLRVGAGYSWKEFPQLQQLEMLTVISPRLSGEELRRLHEQLPHCNVSNPD